MKIQLALDRMSITEAADMVRLTEPYIDWVEIGTSLIKEFGMASVEALKGQFPHKIIVADMKTFDNARYEFEMCYKAGADVATVMGAAPPVTVDLCIETARALGRQVMIDLLHTTPEERQALFRRREAVHCLHVSKDQQEGEGFLPGSVGAAGAQPGAGAAGGPGIGGTDKGIGSVPGGTANGSTVNGSRAGEEMPSGGGRIAVAGGITLDSLPGLLRLRPEVLIVGSAITKAPDPAEAARRFHESVRQLKR